MEKLTEAQVVMDRAMGAVERMGSKRMRDIAQNLEVITEYARATRQYKDDCRLVVAMFRAWAKWIEEWEQDKGRAALQQQENEREQTP